MVNLISVREKLEKAWSHETAYVKQGSYYPVDNTAKGQCVVTALIIQELMGGEIVRGIVKHCNGKTEKHYWNRFSSINDEILDIDLTWRQYPIGTKCTFEKYVSRKQLMASKSVKERYFKLFNKANGF